MRRYMTIALMCAAFTGTEVLADERCLSQFTKFDVCKAAKQFHGEIVEMLPLRMNQNLTLSRALALGPELILYAVWDQTDAEIHQRLRSANTTKDGLISTIQRMTESTVCGQEETAAFIRLGGRMSYHYTTSDGVPVTMVTIDQCPRN